MSTEKWTAVDQYFGGKLGDSDAALAGALEASKAAGLPSINVSANQGKFLQILARSIGARRILEIGTLGGYSTIWLARALAEGGRLITLEYEPKHVVVARANLERAGLSGVVEVREGKAIDNLPALAGGELFDFVFIDADKPSNPDYFAWAMKLTRVGGLIIVDNVVRNGAVVNADSTDTSVLGVRRLVEVIAAEPRVVATVMQTVGAKGYDGFTIAVVVRS